MMSKKPILERDFYLEGRNIFMAEYGARSDNLVIIVPPLFEELARTRKAMINLARMLAGQGMRTVRFDYFGTGLSYGYFQDFSVAGALSDLKAVIGHYEKLGMKSFSFIGFRFGGYLVLEYLHHNLSCVRAILWEPITDLVKYWDELLNIAVGNQLITYGIVKYSKDDMAREFEDKRKSVIDGYEIGYDLYKEFTDPGNRRAITAENTGSRMKILLWRNKKLFQELSKDRQDAAFLHETKLAWDSIRFIDNEPDELLSRTREYILDYEKIPLQIQK